MINNLTVDDFPMVGISAFKERVDMSLSHRKNGTANHCDEIERLMTEVAKSHAEELYQEIDEIREYMTVMVLGLLTQYNKKCILFYNNDRNEYSLDVNLLKQYIKDGTLFWNKDSKDYSLEVK